MGATDPAKADAGTLRKEFGASIENNATHGSDAPETAAFELGYFFRGMELGVSRRRIMGSLLIVGLGIVDRRGSAAGDGRRSARPAAGRHGRSGAARSRSTFPWRRPFC